MNQGNKLQAKLLIFDFDGTIIDSKALYYKVIYSNIKKFGFSYKQVDKAIDLGLSLRKTLRKLGLSFLFSLTIEKKIMKALGKHINEVKKCRNIEAIKNIKQKKILISNSLKEFIMPVIKHLKLRRYFKEIYGADDFSDKVEFIKDYVKRKKINKNNCYYIGDRAADVKLARKAGCLSIIVLGKCSWDSRKEILATKPDFIISDLKDLKKIV